MPFGVVPFQRNTYVLGTCPIGSDILVFFKDSEEVLYMVTTGVLDAKIVNH